MPVIPYRPRHASMPVHRRKRRVAPGIRGPAAKRRRFAGRTRTKRTVRKRTSDVDGTFVKCKDYKRKRVNYKKLKAYKKFSRRVKNIVYSDLPRKIEVQSFAFSVGGFNDILGSAGPDQCIWFQFALDPINNYGITTSNTGHGHAFKLVQSNCTNLNASGVTQMFTQATSNAIPTAAVVRGDNPTLAGLIADMMNNSEVTSLPTSEVNYRIEASHMKYQMKNVAPYGGTLEIFYVRPKRKIDIAPYPSYGGLVASTGATGLNTITNTKPAAYNADTTFSYTPLEVANYGLARQGISGFGNPSCHLNSSVMNSLTQTPEFNDYFKVTGKCKVYIPPGGTLERSVFHKNKRTLTTEYFQNHMSDSRTTYVVCRWTPEVGIINATSGVTPGVMKGENAGVGATPYDLVGVVHYRHKVKSIASTGTNRTRLLVWNTVPVGPAATLQATTTHTNIT